MRNVQKFCLRFAALLLTLSLSGCAIDVFSTGTESATQSNTATEGTSDSTTSTDSSTDSSSSSSSPEDSSSSSSSGEKPEINPAWEIIDCLYALGIGESLEGTYTLTGTVTDISKRGKKDTITIVVEGRETKPIYCYGITGSGVSSLKIGDTATVSGVLKNYQGTPEFDNGCVLLSSSSSGGTTPPSASNDPYESISKATFYQNYSPATSNEDAYYRSLHGFMSGELTVPDQVPQISSYQPKNGAAFVRNSAMLFNEAGDSYTVVDSYGDPAFTVYRNGAYITIEEVAAFVYAFGTYPANYTTSKNADPADSVWGEYLRLNHTRFSGDTDKYPYEPKLPNISGCGGNLNYYEMDVGTTGTDCDPAYETKLYNDGSEITRGAARIVYGKTDLNGNGVYEEGEFHLFYTYNHYNDFQEYLNYEGGWGKKFGNITGGGSISSKYDYNPTPYVPVCLSPVQRAYKALFPL